MKKSAFIPVLATLCIVSLASSTAFAIDIVTRKSQENRLSGEITKVTRDSITLKQQTGQEVEIPANDIEKIEWDGAPATINAALGQERNSRYEEAITSLQSVLDDLDPTATNVRTDVKFFIARTLAKLALADNSRLPDAIGRMKAFTEQNITSIRYYEAMNYLGRLHLAADNYAEAEAAFTSLENSPFQDWQLAGKAYKARVMLAQGQVDQALSAFDAVLNTPAQGEAAQDRLLEAKLGKAKCLNEKNQYDQALTLLEDVVAKAEESDSRLQGEAQILRGQALLAQGKTQEAILAYLLVDILFSGQSDYHAEALYNLSQLWPAVGQPGRAEEARAILESQYPNSPWTKKLSGV